MWNSCKIYLDRNEVDCSWIVTDVPVVVREKKFKNKKFKESIRLLTQYIDSAVERATYASQFKRSGKFITCHMKSFSWRIELVWKFFLHFLPFLLHHRLGIPTHTDILQSDI